jgi:hypothetical protein
MIQFKILCVHKSFQVNKHLTMKNQTNFSLLLQKLKIYVIEKERWNLINSRESILHAARRSFIMYSYTLSIHPISVL